MSYLEAWKQAEKDKAVHDVSPTWTPFEKEGQSVIGKLLGTAEIESTLSKGSYLQYLMDTDDGLIKFHLGRAADNELHTVLKVGNVYKITYLGKEKIKGGRQVNQFKVFSASAPVDLSAPGSDVPF